MKIASNALRSLLRSGSAMGVLFVLGVGAFSPALASNAVSAPAVASPAAAPVMAASADSPATGGNLVPLAPLPVAAASGGHAKGLTSLEDKVSDSIKNVVKQLGSVDSVNLEDLNTARQAVAKLEVLIDIEKHLAELEKVRSSRGGEKSLAAAIPASALSPPPSFSVPAIAPAPRAPAEALPPVGFQASGHTEVSRIMGADGHYVAVIQGRTVRIGDTLSDGSSIVAISAKDVATKLKDGTIRRLKVTGVDEVYGHTL